MGDCIRALQSRLASEGYDPRGIDGFWGVLTATAYRKAVEAGVLHPDDPNVVAARAEVAASVPGQTDAMRLYGPPANVYEDDPARPGWCRWTDLGVWKRANLRMFDLPGVGARLLHPKAAAVYIMAFTDIACDGQYQWTPNMVITHALRRKNQKPGAGLSVHVFGACDEDWMHVGKWQRVFVPTPAILSAWARLRACGLTCGADWTGDSEDMMHFQYGRV